MQGVLGPNLVPVPGLFLKILLADRHTPGFVSNVYKDIAPAVAIDPRQGRGVSKIFLWEVFEKVGGCGLIEGIEKKRQDALVRHCDQCKTRKIDLDMSQK